MKQNLLSRLAAAASGFAGGGITATPRFGFARALLLLAMPVTVQALDFTYSSSGSAITITSYTGAGGAVTIPDTIIGLPVVRIGAFAFNGKTNLTSVIIPNTVTSLGERAFESCSSIESVTFGTNLTSIENQVFAYCSNLTSVTIPIGVTSIGDFLFAYCNSLTNVTIPNSVTNLGLGAFNFCTSLTSVTIPNSVTSLGDFVFNECTSLTNVTIPNGVPNLGKAAFNFCTSLTSVTIPNSVTSLGDFVFSACFGLTNITIPNSVTNLGDYAFQACLRLTNVTIGTNVTSLGDYVFTQCSSLTSITIPNSVTSLGNSAFSYCPSLTRVYFLGNAPAAGVEVFSGTPATGYFLASTSGWDLNTLMFAGIPLQVWVLNFPEIAVISGGVNIADGGLRNFGSVSIGSTGSLTFIITNSGVDPLNLTGTPKVALAGANPEDFNVSVQPTSPVATNGSTTFTVRFSPQGGGARTASLSIANDDADENPFDIVLTGTGFGPEIAVEQPVGTSLTSGTNNVSFGSPAIGAASVRTFTVKNIGFVVSLTLGTASLSGPNAGDFTANTTGMPAFLSAGAQTTFTVTFAPSSAGAASATLSLINNDTTGGEAPFLITLTGTGSTSSQVASFGNPGSVTGGWVNGGNFTIGIVGTANPANNWPAGQAPATATDGNSGSVFLLFQGSNAGLILSPADSSLAYNRLAFTTAGDATERDPASYIIYGSTTALTTTSGANIPVSSLTVIASGTLTLPAARNTGPTVVQFANTTAYASYVVVFPTVKNVPASSITQIAEVKLSQGMNAPNAIAMGTARGGQLVGNIFNFGTSGNTGNQWPAGQSPDNALDGDVNANFLLFRNTGMGLIASPSGGAALVNRLSFWTAGDAPERDPISYAVYGFNTVVTQASGALTVGAAIATGTLTLPTNRLAGPVTVSFVNNTPYASYLVVFPAVRSAPDITAIAEVQFGYVPPYTPPAGTDKTLTVAASSTNTLTLADWGFTDPLDNPSNNFAAVKITTLPATGTLKVDGTNATAGQAVAFQPTSPAGTTWTARGGPVPRKWTSIASSADGSKLAAVVSNGKIYTSTDSGLSWTARDSDRFWTSIASSADGSKLAAVAQFGQIYTSTDSGLSWTARASSLQWKSIASSADGSKLAAVVNGGQIYTSTDSGLSWTGRESSRQWNSIASSADGTKLAAVVGGGEIYTSTDSGMSWIGHPSTGGLQWQSIASSADGNKLAAVVSGLTIFTSTDSGATWTARATDANRQWVSIASSADGSKLAAVVGFAGGQIYTSTDSGLNWTARDSNRKWTSITSSADGGKLAAVVNDTIDGGFIYTSAGPLPVITYTAPAGPGSASFTFQVQDDGAFANLDLSPNTLTFNYAPASTAPVVSTPTSTSTLATAATLGGNVTADGGSTVTERGVVYSLTGDNANPLIGGGGVTKVTASGTIGVFTAPVTGLTANMSYSFKAYAINGVGTTYTSGATFLSGGSPVTSFTETFEGEGGFDVAGWTRTSFGGSVNWVLSTAVSHSATHSWFSAEGSSTAHRALTSPVVAVGVNSLLQFWHAYQFEDISDGGTLEYSSDGSTWTTVPDAAFTAGGFTHTIGLSTNPIGGKHAWSGGTLGAMTPVVVNLGSFATGQNIRIRWHAGEDESGSNLGWYVDDVSVTTAVPEIAVYWNDFDTETEYLRLSGESQAFGSVNMGSARGLDFRIWNLGTAPLNLTGSPRITVTGSADFTVSIQPPESALQPMFYSDFRVTFTPSSAGPKTATLTIANNDSDEGTYTIVLNGTGVVPNTAPTDLTLSSTNLAENTSPGSPVATITATDADAGQTHTFTLVAGAGSTDNAAFAIVGNSLAVIASTDFETKSNYFIRLRATDNGAGNLTFEKQFIVTITDVTYPQTITFGALGGKTFGDAPFTVSATGGASGQPVTFSIASGPATIAGNTVTITGAGDVTVRASQAGSVVGDFGAATPVDQTFTVGKATQTITFNPPTTALTNDTVTLSATGGASGNPVTFSLMSGPGVLTGNDLTFTGPGAVVVRASQVGNANYFAALYVERTITVSVPLAPEIAVNRVEYDFDADEFFYFPITNGGNFAFGTLLLGSTNSRYFQIENLGSTNLNLTGTPRVALSGSTHFSVSFQPADASLAPGTIAGFTVRFAPTSSGLKTATLTITNNDSDESVFTILLTGSGNTAPVLVDHCDGAISGTPAIIPAVKLLAGASDLDGDPLTLASVSAASTNGGTVAIIGTNVTYTPLGGFIGTDAFTYTVSDGRGGSASAKVVMNVLDATLPLLNRLEVVRGSNAPLVRFVGLPCHDYTLLRSLVPQGPFIPLLTFTAPASGLIEHLDTTPLTNIVIVTSYTDTNSVTHFRTNPPYSSVFFRMVTQP